MTSGHASHIDNQIDSTTVDCLVECGEYGVVLGGEGRAIFEFLSCATANQMLKFENNCV